MQHRVVLYTEDLEPITVLQITDIALKRLIEQSPVALACMDRPAGLIPSPDEQPTDKFRTLTILTERLQRNGKTHPMLLLKDSQGARVLRAAYLPADQHHLTEYEAQGIVNSFLDALEGLG